MTMAAVIQELTEDPRLIYRHTVADYHRMIADGRIEEGSVIINLVDVVVEAYTRPMKGKGRYGQVETLSPKGTVSLMMPSRDIVKVPVRRLLP
jgi:hypothetical protein